MPLPLALLGVLSHVVIVLLAAHSNFKLKEIKGLSVLSFFDKFVGEQDKLRV
jgi:hypothetical protein